MRIARKNCVFRATHCAVMAPSGEGAGGSGDRDGDVHGGGRLLADLQHVPPPEGLDVLLGARNVDLVGDVDDRLARVDELGGLQEVCPLLEPTAPVRVAAVATAGGVGAAADLDVVDEHAGAPGLVDLLDGVLRDEVGLAAGPLDRLVRFDDAHDALPFGNGT